MDEQPKPLFWMGSSLRDLREMPLQVQDAFGYALHIAQIGKKHPTAKPLRGFGNAGVLEVVEDAQQGTFRAVYTANLGGSLYVLHCFQKKATRGIKTSKHDLELIQERLKQARLHSRGIFT